MRYETKQKLKDIAVRAAKTFIQAFAASLTIDAGTLEGGANVWRSVLISACAAGLSAVMNFFVIELSN